MGWINENQLPILFGLSLAFLSLYIFFYPFRIWLELSKFDPNFLVAFVTALALVLSLIQNRIDKRYAYNSALVASIEGKGVAVIGKLLSIKGKSRTLLFSAEKCLDALRKKITFVDANNALDKESIEHDLELIAAYIDMFFPDQCERWNTLLDRLSDISTLAGNILLNYDKNIELIKQNIDFKNAALDSSPDSFKKISELNDEIAQLSYNIRQAVVAKINEVRNGAKKYH